MANPHYKDIATGSGGRIVGIVVEVLKNKPLPLHEYENLVAVTSGLKAEWASLTATAANYGLRPQEIENFVEMIAGMVRRMKE